MTLRYIELVAAGQRWRVDLRQAASIAIALDFAGQQPSFFNAPPARMAPLKVGGFIGDVSAGGSCHCPTLSLTPHCNGTHTESVGHVVQEAVPIHDVATEALLIARVISIEPMIAVTGSAPAHSAAQPGDRVITAAQLQDALSATDSTDCTALVIRTMPNSIDKLTRRYDPELGMPPYFSDDAMDYIVARNVQHLVVDLPSIDRAADEGRLSCHRIFWALPERSITLAEARRADATITELAYINNDIPDGLYLLNLQLPAFASDAAPSRPVLYPLQAVDA